MVIPVKGKALRHNFHPTLAPLNECVINSVEALATDKVQELDDGFTNDIVPTHLCSSAPGIKYILCLIISIV